MAANQTNMLLIVGAAGVAGFLLWKNRGLFPSAVAPGEPANLSPINNLFTPRSSGGGGGGGGSLAPMQYPLPSAPSPGAVPTDYGPVIPSQFVQPPTALSTVTASGLTSGPVYECMVRKTSDGWSQTTCETRLAALADAYAQLKTWMVQYNQAVENVRVALVEIDKVLATPNLDQATIDRYTKARLDYLAALAPWEAGYPRVQAAMASHVADYVALTGINPSW